MIVTKECCTFLSILDSHTLTLILARRSPPVLLPLTLPSPLLMSVNEEILETKCRPTRPAYQMMAPLPNSSLQASARAFERVGVGYAAPFLTEESRGKKKAKRCLFTCLATSTVHLEMSYALDIDSFISAFTRMTSRSGTPTYVLSDNGTRVRNAAAAATLGQRQGVQRDHEELSHRLGFESPVCPQLWWSVRSFGEKCQEGNQGDSWRCTRVRWTIPFVEPSTC